MTMRFPETMHRSVEAIEIQPVAPLPVLQAVSVVSPMQAVASPLASGTLRFAPCRGRRRHEMYRVAWVASAGGYLNEALGYASMVLGGRSGLTSGFASLITGGRDNIAEGSYAPQPAVNSIPPADGTP